MVWLASIGRVSKAVGGYQKWREVVMEVKPPKCQRCLSANTKAYGQRWLCVMCGWTWHQLSESMEQEILTRFQTTSKKVVTK